MSIVDWVEKPTERDEKTMDERECHLCGAPIAYALIEVHDTLGATHEVMVFHLYGVVDNHNFCESCAMEYELI